MQRTAMFWPTLGVGGVERQMLRIAGGLAEQGLEVDVVVASAAGGLRSEISPLVGLHNLNMKLGGGRLTLAAFPLARYLRSRRPTALLSAMTQANMVAFAAARLAGWQGQLIFSERVSLSFHRTKMCAAKEVLLKAAMRSMLSTCRPGPLRLEGDSG